MIFPDIRISQLSKERAQRAASFKKSREGLSRVVSDEIRPANLIKHGKGPLIGALLSLLSLAGVGRLVAKSGWMGRLATFGGGMAARKVGPLALAALKFAVGLFLTRRRKDF